MSKVIKMKKEIDSNIIDSIARLDKAIASAQEIRVEINGYVSSIKVCLILENDGISLLEFLEGLLEGDINENIRD